jgi:hypothetical protein
MHEDIEAAEKNMRAFVAGWNKREAQREGAIDDKMIQTVMRIKVLFALLKQQDRAADRRWAKK